MSLILRRYLLVLLPALLSALTAFGAESGGTVAGTVSNAATRNLLEGARVEARGAGRAALTDATGRYVIDRLPPGPVELVVTYLGLDEQRRSVTVAAGGRVTQDFDLSAQVYRLGEFRVTGEREGNALALTAQRNADNLKNVAALDAYGNLPNMSAGELAVRLPGVASQFDDEGNVTGVFIRGAASTLNRVNVDGQLMSNVGGFNRQFQTHSLTGAMFEQLEVIKGHTPDQTADSLGGTVNLKTRSTLGMKERRRFAYSLGARWAPSFFDQIQPRLNHPLHPLNNFAYQEVFDVAGGSRNLGVAVNLFYSENVNGPGSRQFDYQNSATGPLYLWDFRTQNQYNNRTQKSVNVKAEYRLSERTRVTLNTIYNDAFEKTDQLYTTRAFSNQTVAALVNGVPGGTGAVVPGYTDTRTEVRPVAGSSFELNTFLRRFLNRTRLVSLAAEHTFDRWTIDYDASYSRTHNNLAHEPGGNLVMRAVNVGWTVDVSDRANPVFTQTAGPSLFDIASYRSAVSLTTRNDGRDVDVLNARLNAAWRLPVVTPATLKTGVYFRHQKMAETGRRRQWSYLASAPAMAATFPDVYAFRSGDGRRLPFVDPHAAYENTGNPALWSEDLYFRTADAFSTTRDATEKVAAGYAQGQFRAGPLGVLGGVRAERTEVSGFGYVRVRPATAAQIPDPVARARHDWDHPVRNAGSYTRPFPSIHLTWNFTPNLRAQGSWSTSFGRPPVTNLVPSASITDNATTQTVTIPNPALGPQYARNVDLSLQYYFPAAGVLSFGYFRKDIRDYIVTTNIGTVGAGPDNGFDGSYAGFMLLSSANAGTAEVRGWELDYRQQLTFLPAIFRGLSASANLTVLETEGNFGGAAQRSNKEVQNFIPRTGNAGLTYTAGRFRANVLLNYTGDYLVTPSALAHRNIYRGSRTLLNAGVAWQWRPTVSIFCDASNLTNAPQETYFATPDRIQRRIINAPALTFGLNGRF